MNKCAVVIPIYKSEISDFEKRNFEISLRNLQRHDVYLLIPENLEIASFFQKFQSIKLAKFEDKEFSSISSYSRLMLSKRFFKYFNGYTHILINQLDAIVLKPELNYWINQPYDYIGAPWPGGYELTIKTKKIPKLSGIKCKAYIGNGGLSLRRIDACLKLFEEHRDIHDEWVNLGHAEDLFFGFAGYLSRNFKLPNVFTAAHFSHETQADYLYQLIGEQLPFGAHGFDKYPNKVIDEIIFKKKGSF